MDEGNSTSVLATLAALAEATAQNNNSNSKYSTVKSAPFC